MSGFIDLKVSKIARTLITRSIAVIPSLVIVLIRDVDQFNDKLNIL